MADNTLITINLSDDPKLKYGTTSIKRKALVKSWATESDKEISMRLTVKYYASNAGAYGSDSQTAILADASITPEQRAWQAETFKDREIFYSTRGKWVSVTGVPVAEGTAGAITELEYWQGFPLSSVAGISSTAVGAFAAVYLIATAMIQRMDVLKVLG